MTVRGVCYRLFSDNLIKDMSRKETGQVSRILVTARLLETLKVAIQAA